MTHPIFTGTIRPDGRPELDDKAGFTTLCRSLIGKRIELILRPHKSTRSSRQRAYYYAVIVRRLSEYIGYSKTETNELLKLKFNPLELTVKGEKVLVGMSIENEKTDRVEEIYRDIREWAFEFFGIHIPEPNEIDLPEE